MKDLKNSRQSASYLVATLALAIGALLASSCESGSGACTGFYGSGKTECKQDWDESECADWDTKQVNGSDWTFHSGQSCADLGYTKSCNHSYLRSSDTCN